MNKKKRKKIENSIKDAFQLKERFADFEVSFSNQLLSEQLDLLKNLAGIIIAVIGIGYLFEKISINVFSVAGFVFSIISLILIFSYIREMIDIQANGLKEAQKGIEHRTDEMINKAIEAIESDNASICFDYAKKEYKKIKNVNPELIYLGEIILFLFFTILSSMIGVIAVEKINIEIIYQLFLFALILLISWQMSFREWSVPLIKLLSKKFCLKNNDD